MPEPVTHYADDDTWQPLCGHGHMGDLMTFGLQQTTCEACKAAGVGDALDRLRRAAQRDGREVGTDGN